ncbi:unnamed protein product, partial [Onchocerca ochengi]|uniref:FAA_hydrolase domain-containing protein n=1 Tax=Onchocerca ochengi TaxID=42157 RepID=A0A182ET12_ONCOC
MAGPAINIFSDSRKKSSATRSVDEVFKKCKIVPDVVSTAPAKLVEVSYNNFMVYLGNALTPTLVRNQPTEISWDAEPGSLYTLAFIGIQLVVNIPGQNVSEGEILAEYVGAGAPKGTG